MKNTFLLLLLSFVLLVGCAEDDGNYTYSPLETIEVANIEREQTKIFMRDRLQIRPEIKTSDPNADLEGTWSFDRGEVISKSIDLDTLIDWNPGDYSLLFSLKNKRTGYTVYYPVRLRVDTEFSTGWYVFKDNGEVADLDLYREGKMIPNVISMVNGDGMKGKAEKISYFIRHKVFDPEANSYAAKKMLFLITDKDINGIDALTAYRWRKFEDVFFEAPKVRKPNFMVEGWMGVYMANDGKVYPLGISGATSGKFLNKRNLDGDYDNYQVSKYACHEAMKRDILVFDTIRSSFYSATFLQDNLELIKDAPGSDMSCCSNNKRLLYMGQNKNYQSSYYYAVFQDKTDPAIKVMSKIKLMDSPFTPRTVTLKIFNDTLPVGSPAYNAVCYTVSHTEEVMYFATEDGLYSKNVGGEGKGGVVNLEYSIPAGEKATLVKSLFMQQFGINYVVLATVSNGSYKVRMFEKTTAGHLNPLPVLELPRSGERMEGRVGDVIYVDQHFTGSYIPGY